MTVCEDATDPLASAEQFLGKPRHRACLALLTMIPVPDELTLTQAAADMRAEVDTSIHAARVKLMLGTLGRWFTIGHTGGVIYWRRTADEVAMVERVLDKVASVETCND